MGRRGVRRRTLWAIWIVALAFVVAVLAALAEVYGWKSGNGQSHDFSGKTDPQIVRELSYLLHDFTFIVFAVSLVGHIYLSTAAEPGTFGSMVRGTVTRQWARLHHPRWLREVTGETVEKPRRG